MGKLPRSEGKARKVCKTSVALAESSEGQLLTRLHPLRQGASEKGLQARGRQGGMGAWGQLVTLQA